MNKQGKLNRSSSQLSEKSRRLISDHLSQCVANGIDLFTQVKVAHWNIKGPQFTTLHPFLDGLADKILSFNDDIAERAVILGSFIRGSAKWAAGHSALPDYPAEHLKQLKHVEQVLKRVEIYLQSITEARNCANEHNDFDTADLLTSVNSEMEKQAWFLIATLN